MYDSNKSYNPGILIGSQKLITTILNVLLQALMGLHEEFEYDGCSHLLF